MHDYIGVLAAAVLLGEVETKSEAARVGVAGVIGDLWQAGRV